MNRVLSFKYVLLLITAVWFPMACTSDSGNDSYAWNHEELEVDGVPTVHTISGSIWEGPAHLVEELSIGSRDEAGPTLFGRISGVDATDDRIYVLDSVDGEIRVFDFNGTHLFSFGRHGAGPGEFRMPSGFAVWPEGGRVFLRDISLGRVNVYDLDGSPVDTWKLSTYYGSFRITVITDDGRVYVPVTTRRGPDRDGMGQIGPESSVLDTLWASEWDHEQTMLRANRLSMSLPFGTSLEWIMSPFGVMIEGFSEQYRLSVRSFQHEILRIERDYDPIPVLQEERSWHHDQVLAVMRRDDPSWAWRGANVPRQKPAFEYLVADHSERIWVIRQGPGVKIKIPEEEQSEKSALPRSVRWEDTQIIEVFGLDGRYYGVVEAPEELYLTNAHIKGDLVITTGIDSEGVQYIKRYRLVTP